MNEGLLASMQKKSVPTRKHSSLRTRKISLLPTRKPTGSSNSKNYIFLFANFQTFSFRNFLHFFLNFSKLKISEVDNFFFLFLKRLQLKLGGAVHKPSRLEMLPDTPTYPHTHTHPWPPVTFFRILQTPHPMNPDFTAPQGLPMKTSWGGGEVLWEF